MLTPPMFLRPGMDTLVVLGPCEASSRLSLVLMVFIGPLLFLLWILMQVTVLYQLERSPITKLDLQRATKEDGVADGRVVPNLGTKNVKLAFQCGKVMNHEGQLFQG